MEEEKKVRIKLEKVLLESERKERQEKAVIGFVLFLVCCFFFVLGITIGTLFMPKNILGPNNSLSTKIDEIKYYMENYWIYSKDYENFSEELDDRAAYGVTSFSEDPFTSYMSVKEYESFSDGINMNYSGIGVQYFSNEGVNVVSKVFRNSPAEIAGILPGDIINDVDGVPIENKSGDEIKDLVLGENGSEVVIGINRNGEYLSITCIRGPIDSTVYAYKEDDYVILEISSFGESTGKEIISSLSDYEDLHKIIIDLRKNGGGYQGSVLEVAGLFIGNNKLVMSQTDVKDKSVNYYSSASKHFDNFDKIVIITNHETASASEVFTLCLKEQLEDVTIVGETTYGKGVVQSSRVLSDGNILKVTTSRWFSPNGTFIGGEGIKPDIEVYLDDVLYETFPKMEDDDEYDYDSVSVYTICAQDCLKYLDYDVLRNDGYFNKELKDTIARYQSDKGLNVTGTLNKETYDSLFYQTQYYWNIVNHKDYQFLKAKELMK